MGLKHGKHSFEKEAIAMWTRTKHPTQGKNTSVAAFMVDLKHPQLLRKKGLSLSLKPWHSEIPPRDFYGRGKSHSRVTHHTNGLSTTFQAVTLLRNNVL